MDQSLYQLQQVLDGVGDRVSQSKPQLWTWVVAKLVSPSHWGRLSRAKERSQLPYMNVLWVGSPSPTVRDEGHLSKVAVGGLMIGKQTIDDYHIVHFL